MPINPNYSRSDAIARYTSIAHRMPSASFPDNTLHVEHLGDLVEHIDVFVLDGFGVINIGNEPIPGAVERITHLQSLGKQVLVLTNGATMPVEVTHQKYLRWGLEFALHDIVSSRNALEHALRSEDNNMLWGVCAKAGAQIDKLAPNAVLLEDDSSVYDSVDGFVFLSATQWSDSRQRLLENALRKRDRKMLVGNPDLVAPQESGMSLEPGLYAHALADAGLCNPRFYGKPYQSVFEIVKQRIKATSADRIAMVGDTLHTDILGGAAAGWRTVLIKDFGLMKYAHLEATCSSTGIRPDFVARVT